MNVLLCEIENEILICCVNYFDEKETPINTFVFDGLMIDNTVVLNLDELSNYVFENIGYRVQYVVKDFDSTIDLRRKKNSEIYKVLEEKNYDKIELKPLGLERIQLGTKLSIIEYILSLGEFSLNSDLTSIFKNLNDFSNEYFNTLSDEDKFYLFLSTLELSNPEVFNEFTKVMLKFSYDFSNKNNDIICYY